MERLLAITLSLVLPFLVAARKSDNALSGQDGALFVYQNDVIVTPDTWLLALSVELRPYEPHMTAIDTEIRTFQKAVRSYASDLQTVNNTLGIHFDDNLLPMLVHEIGQLKLNYEELQRVYEEIPAIFSAGEESSTNERKRRSLIPIVGSLLSKLLDSYKRRSKTYSQEYCRTRGQDK